MPNEEMGKRAPPQPPEVSDRPILMVVGGFLVFVALAIAGLLLFLQKEAPRALVPRVEQPFPQPALQKLPQSDLARFEAAQRSALSGYAWVDRDHGLARIPIDEAMQMIASRGAHAYDPLQASSPSEPTRGGSP
jgi:hypothetical protein